MRPSAAAALPVRTRRCATTAAVVWTTPTQLFAAHQPLHQRRGRVVASADSTDGAAAAAAAAAATPQPPAEEGATPGKLYEVTLKMPIGVVFAQTQGPRSPTVVEAVTEGGSADRAGLRAGDVLVACSAVQLKAGTEGKFEKEGYGARPYDNFETSIIDVQGLEFKTVMGALKSNNPRWGVTSVTLRIRRGASSE